MLQLHEVHQLKGRDILSLLARWVAAPALVITAVLSLVRDDNQAAWRANLAVPGLTGALPSSPVTNAV